MNKYFLYLFTTGLTLSTLLIPSIAESAGLSAEQKAAIERRRQQTVQSPKSPPAQDTSTNTKAKPKPKAKPKAIAKPKATATAKPESRPKEQTSCEKAKEQEKLFLTTQTQCKENQQEACEAVHTACQDITSCNAEIVHTACEEIYKGCKIEKALEVCAASQQAIKTLLKSSASSGKPVTLTGCEMPEAKELCQKIEKSCELVQTQRTLITKARKKCEEEEESAKKLAETQAKYLATTVAVNIQTAKELLRICLDETIDGLWACDLAEQASHQACTTVKHVTEMTQLSEKLAGQPTQIPSTSTEIKDPNPKADSDELDQFAGQFAGTGVFLDIENYRNQMASATQSPNTMSSAGHPPIKTIDKCPPGVGQANEKCFFTITHSSSGGPPPFTVTPLKGGKAFIVNKYKLSERAKAKKFEIKDPKDKAKIDVVMENVKKRHASLFEKAEKLFKASSRDRQQESSSLQRYVSNWGKEGLNTGIATHSIHGANSMSHGTVSDLSQEAVTASHADSEFTHPVIDNTNLISQFNSMRDLQENYGNSEQYESEHSMPFGKDKIGLKENNLFFMANESYEKHRKADEFIEGNNKPSPAKPKPKSKKKVLIPGIDF